MRSAAESLIDQARLFYQSLMQIGDQIHAGSGISMGMRAVLEYLDREGQATVPDMARARRVTRQRIQTLVNALIDRSLVEPSLNPASRRSPLIGLTARGRSTIHAMRRREQAYLQVEVPDRQLQQAEATLRKLREALERRNRPGGA